MKLSGKKKFEFILANQFPFASTFHHSSFRADSVFYLFNCLFLLLSLEALILLIKKERKKKKKTPKWSPVRLVVSLALRNINNQNQKISGKDLRSLARNKTFKGTILVLTASSLASVQTL